MIELSRKKPLFRDRLNISRIYESLFKDNIVMGSIVNVLE